jgi:hypothetical protein
MIMLVFVVVPFQLSSELFQKQKKPDASKLLEGNPAVLCFELEALSVILLHH